MLSRTNTKLRMLTSMLPHALTRTFIAFVLLGTAVAAHAQALKQVRALVSQAIAD